MASGMRGEITSVRRASAQDEGRFIGTVMVEGDKQANESFDKAHLIVTRDTGVFAQRGNKRQRAKFEDLKVGNQIEVRFVEGPTIMMYPLQVAAAEIVILHKAGPEDER